MSLNLLSAAVLIGALRVKFAKKSKPLAHTLILLQQGYAYVIILYHSPCHNFSSSTSDSALKVMQVANQAGSRAESLCTCGQGQGSTLLSTLFTGQNLT